MVLTRDRVGDTAETVFAGDVAIGPDHPIRVIAGPCSVESLDQFRETAVAAKASGAVLLRGGAFKPRTSPYSFQGLGARGLAIMREVADDVGLGIVTEAMSPGEVELVAGLAEMIQIGARNMENVTLVAEAAGTGKPILLKRGPASTIDQLLSAVERIHNLGNDQIVVCERGSRTFEPSIRYSLDIAAVAEIKKRAALPVIIDPSHGTGRADLVPPVTLAGIAAGADGLMVEVHPAPASALSDGPQSLDLPGFALLMDGVRRMAEAVDRGL